MSAPAGVRSVQRSDYAQWRALWDGYNSFYGRAGRTALAESITASTWERFFQPAEPVRCFVAEAGARLAGLAHLVFHRSTTRLRDVCYLQDLYTVQPLRGQGIGRALIEAVYEAAKAAACSRVYGQTQATNAAGRMLYEKLARHDGFIVYSHEID